MKITYFFAMLLVLLCTTGGLFALDTNWTGNVNSDWNNPGNWTVGVPGPNHSVGISDMPNDPVISTPNAAAQSINIGNNGILTITSTGTLTGDIFWNNPTATVVNNGTLTFNALLNYNTFTNNPGGQLIINTNLYNAAPGTFNNAGNIAIGAGTYPLQNLGMFNNNTGGQINIAGVSGNGISIHNISGIFTNEGNIAIGTSQSSGIYSISNNATFNNDAGQINIKRSTHAGIYNDNGTFNNQAVILIDSTTGVGYRGIDNYNATFNNNTGGQITINRSTVHGILHHSGTFDNSGTITIGNIASIGSYGIESRSTFNNNAGGQIHIDGASTSGIWLNNVSLNNAGTVVIGSLAPINLLKTTNATFVNVTGGVFGGSGYVTGLNNFVNSGGTLLPGYDTTGILSFNSSSSFSSLSLSIDVNGTGAPGANYDQLATSIAPGLGGGALHVSINYTPAIGDRIVILTASSEISDTFATVTGLPANWHLVYYYGEVDLIYGALQSTWTGAVSTDWFHAGNWTAGAPHAFCEAIIPDVTNEPVIAAAGAVAMSVTVQSSSSLTLADEGTLTIMTLVSEGLLNEGTVQNDGVINVSPYTPSGYTYHGNYHGILNKAVFNNNMGAVINLYNSFNVSLHNDSLGTFTNYGSIIVGTNAVNNEGPGILNFGTFNNNTGGLLQMDRMKPGTVALVNGGIFNNQASIHIGSLSGGNLAGGGIQNVGTFNNNTGGLINIDRIDLYPIFNYVNGIFHNQASINIGSLSGGNTMDYGILNFFANFINSTSGQINIDRVDIAIYAYEDTIVNAGTFTIGALTTVTNLVDGVGIGTFSNNTGGLFKATGNIAPTRFSHAGGILAPGHSFGTLTFTTGEDFNAGILNMEIRESAGVISKDSIRVNGNIALTGGTLNIVANGTLPGGLHQLFSFNTNTGNTHFTTVNYPPTCTGCSLLYFPNAIWLNNPNTCATNLTLNNQTLPTGTYRSQGDLTATLSTVPNGGNVEFKSDTGVLLQADFTVPLGGVFEILIEGCQ